MVLESPHLEVLFDGERREDIVRLGNKADAHADELVSATIRDRLPAKSDVTRANGHEPEQRFEECRLSGAVRSDDADELAFSNRHRTAVEDVDAWQVAGDQIGCLEDDGGIGSGARSADVAHRRSSERSVSWCAPR